MEHKLFSEHRLVSSFDLDPDTRTHHGKPTFPDLSGTPSKQLRVPEVPPRTPPTHATQLEHCGYTDHDNDNSDDEELPELETRSRSCIENLQIFFLISGFVLVNICVVFMVLEIGESSTDASRNQTHTKDQLAKHRLVFSWRLGSESASALCCACPQKTTILSALSWMH